MRIDEGATFIHRADAVRVAIRHHAEVAHPGTDGRSQCPKVFRDWFRMHAPETGIHLPADFCNLTARALQEGLDYAAPRAIHRIHHKTLWIVGDDVGVDQ